MNWKNKLELSEHIGCSFYEAGKILKYLHRLDKIQEPINSGDNYQDPGIMEVYDDRTHTGFDIIWQEDYGRHPDGTPYNFFSIYFTPYCHYVMHPHVVFHFGDTLDLGRFVANLPMAYAAVKVMQKMAE